MPILIASIVGSFLASYGAKLLSDAFLTERIAIIGDFAGLRPTLNPGVAFSLDLGNFEGAVILIALLCVCVAAFRSAKTVWSQIGFGIIIGGAVGNVIDRMTDGVVTDFFQVGTFPIFNVADSCITVGVGILLAEALFSWYRTKGRR